MIQVLFTFKTWIDNSKQKPAEQISANKTQMVQKHNVEFCFFCFDKIYIFSLFEFLRKIVSLFTYLGPQTQAWVV